MPLPGPAKKPRTPSRPDVPLAPAEARVAKQVKAALYALEPAHKEAFAGQAKVLRKRCKLFGMGSDAVADALRVLCEALPALQPSIAELPPPHCLELVLKFRLSKATRAGTTAAAGQAKTAAIPALDADADADKRRGIADWSEFEAKRAKAAPRPVESDDDIVRIADSVEATTPAHSPAHSPAPAPSLYAVHLTDDEDVLTSRSPPEPPQPPHATPSEGMQPAPILCVSGAELAVWEGRLRDQVPAILRECCTRDICMHSAHPGAAAEQVRALLAASKCPGACALRGKGHVDDILWAEGHVRRA